MFSITYFILVGICLLAVIIRTAYEQLKKLGVVKPENKLIFAIVFVAMMLMLLSWPFMCPLDPLPLTLNLPVGVRWAGMAMLAAGLGLALGSLIQLRGVENIDHLVTSGLFSKLRHPMYAGFILWIAGWVVYCGAGASLVAAGLASACILYWRKLEEDKLGEEYGEVYRNYREMTWF